MDFKHLRKTQQNYFKHSWFAIRWGVFIVITGILSIVHGLLPFLFPFESPRRIMKIAKMILLRGHEEEIPPDDRDFWNKQSQ